jgi:NADH dehydrogenase
VIGDGTTAVYPLFVQDLARVVALAVRREEDTDVALELGGPERLSMDQVIRTVQVVLGKRRPLLHHPAGLMKLLVAPLQLLPDPILSPGAIDFVLQDVELDPGPAMEHYGVGFRTLEQGLREYL